MLHENKLRFAGIGPRKTPAHVLAQMTEIGRILANEGWVGVSGFSPGADQAWLAAVPFNQQEVWLPWWNYENALSHQDPEGRFHKVHVSEEIRAVAKSHYLHDFEALKVGAQLLFARNVAIMARDTLDTAVDMVCYWQDPKDIDSSYGGTNHALRVAKEINIPCFNIGNDDELQALSDFANARMKER